MTTEPLPAHLDCPTCPACSAPCGSSVSAENRFLCCGACGELWQGTAAEVTQARRADAAYERERVGEDERKRLADEVAALPEKVRATNRRMLDALAHRDVKPDNAEQLDLLGGAA